MNDKTTITMRIDKKLKEEVATIFKDFGLTLSSATILFYKQVLKEKNIPFTIGNSNYANEIKRIVKECEDEKNLKQFDSLEEFKKYYEEI